MDDGLSFMLVPRQGWAFRGQHCSSPAPPFLPESTWPIFNHILIWEASETAPDHEATTTMRPLASSY